MSLTISPQIRIVAIAGLVAIVLLGGGVMMLGRSHTVAVPPAGARHGAAAAARHRPATTGAHKATTPATAAPATAAKHAATTAVTTTGTAAHAAPKTAAKAASPATVHAATGAAQKTAAHAAAHKAVAAHAATHAKAKYRGNPVYADLPAPLQWQLSHHKVVVVSFYNPNAEVDAISVAEAHAGAVAAGSGFLLVSVLNDKVAGILTGLLPGGGLLPEPGVLIYKAPGTIVVRFDGFVDRDTVAQAATNAGTMQLASADAATPATTTTAGAP